MIGAIKTRVPRPVFEIKSEIPHVEALSQVLHRAMAKNPQNRFAAADEFRSALEEADRNGSFTPFNSASVKAQLDQAETALFAESFEDARAILDELERGHYISIRSRSLRQQLEQGLRPSQQNFGAHTPSAESTGPHACDSPAWEAAEALPGLSNSAAQIDFRALGSSASARTMEVAIQARPSGQIGTRNSYNFAKWAVTCGIGTIVFLVFLFWCFVQPGVYALRNIEPGERLRGSVFTIPNTKWMTRQKISGEMLSVDVWCAKQRIPMFKRLNADDDLAYGSGDCAMEQGILSPSPK